MTGILSPDQFRNLLTEYSAGIPYRPSYDEELPPGSGPVLLGREPATEEQLQVAEERLGTTLPPSLRNFLLVCNGWEHPDNLYTLLGTERLLWAAVGPDDLAAEWSHDEEIFALLSTCLIVMDDESGAYGLLDRAQVDADGEWRAYSWAAGDGLDPKPFDNFSAFIQAATEGNLW